MIEELTSFEIKKIFGEGLKPSTYKILYDLILDLQKQFTQIGIDNDTFKAQLKATITDKIKLELNNLIATGQLQEIISNELYDKLSEVREARGSFPTIGKRLDDLDNKENTISIRKFSSYVSNGDWSPALREAIDYINESDLSISLDCKIILKSTIPIYKNDRLYIRSNYNAEIDCTNINGVVFKAENEKTLVQCNLYNIQFKGGRNSTTLFKNLYFIAGFFDQANMYGFLNCFDTCNFFAITKVRNCRCMYQGNSFITNSRLVDCYFENNYFTGSNHTEGNYSQYANFIESGENTITSGSYMANTTFNNNWFEFYNILFSCGDGQNDFIGNTFDYTIQIMLGLKGKENFKNNKIMHSNKTTCNNNLVNSGQLPFSDDFLNSETSLLEVADNQQFIANDFTFTDFNENNHVFNLIGNTGCLMNFKIESNNWRNEFGLSDIFVVNAYLLKGYYQSQFLAGSIQQIRLKSEDLPLLSDPHYRIEGFNYLLEDGRILKGINTDPLDSTNEDKWQLYEVDGTPAFYKDFPVIMHFSDLDYNGSKLTMIDESIPYKRTVTLNEANKWLVAYSKTVSINPNTLYKFKSIGNEDNVLIYEFTFLDGSGGTIKKVYDSGYFNSGEATQLKIEIKIHTGSLTTQQFNIYLPSIIPYSVTNNYGKIIRVSEDISFIEYFDYTSNNIIRLPY